MDNFETTFLPFQHKMSSDDTHPLVIEAFRRNLDQLISGTSFTIDREQLTDLDYISNYDELEDFSTIGAKALQHTLIIKLNGGLGTSMGLERAKSLIPVRGKQRFIDIIIRQVLKLREQSASTVPLLLLDSLKTQADSLAALAEWSVSNGTLPLSLLQHRVPKVMEGTMTPAEWPQDQSLEWCPPGHGDLYLALETSGLLDNLLENGYRYAFISNADNLGAVMDMNILGYFISKGYNFLMEAAERTAADRKGGHLTRMKDGRLALRELAQCPTEETAEFQDISLYRYFNTNSIWLHLSFLRELLHKHQGILPLPLIRNKKHLDPRDSASPVVFQLETAMGAAISLFDNAAALCVPRTRFAPVKTTDDLLAVRSDAMLLDEEYRIIPHPARTLPAIHIVLDPQYYRFIGQLDERFPKDIPSLRECESLRIDGDIHFGGNIILRGKVHLTAENYTTRFIPDDSIIEEK